MLQKESKPIAQGGTCSGVLLDQSDEQGVMNYLRLPRGLPLACRPQAGRDVLQVLGRGHPLDAGAHGRSGLPALWCVPRP